MVFIAVFGFSASRAFIHVASFRHFLPLFFTGSLACACPLTAADLRYATSWEISSAQLGQLPPQTKECGAVAAMLQ